jgi:hypothetical protein
LLKQGRLSNRSSAEQVITVLAVSEGWLDGLPPEKAPALVGELVARARSELPEIVARLERGVLPEDGWLDALRGLCDGMRGSERESAS